MSRRAGPTFEAALAMMRSRDPQKAEDGFHTIQKCAHECVDELLATLATEEAAGDSGLVGWLLELLGDARDAKALPVFGRYLDDDERRYWAVRGLQKLDTKEARRLLWENGVTDATRES